MISSFTAPVNLPLEAVVLFEKDTNGETYPVWCFPSLSDDLCGVLITRSQLKKDTISLQYSFSKYKDFWLHIYVVTNEPRSAILPRVAVFAVAVVTKAFEPEKYGAFCKLLATIYAAKASPPLILQAYLSVFSSGEFDGTEYGAEKFVEASFDPRVAFLSTSIKDIVRLFGVESILLWSGLLMKKRIVVYSEKISVLLKVVRALPLFVMHRQNWNILRPYVTMDEKELADLKTAGVYCAGFIDSNVKGRDDLYDLFVDVNARSVTVPERAKGDFGMGSLHKEIASLLVDASEEVNVTDQQMVKALMTKTKELLQKLQKLTVMDANGNSSITMEALQQKKLPTYLQQFLYAVASAEGLAKDTQRQSIQA